MQTVLDVASMKTPVTSRPGAYVRARSVTSRISCFAKSFGSPSSLVNRTMTLPDESETQKEVGRGFGSRSFSASSFTQRDRSVISKEAPICSRRRGDEKING